MKMIQIRNVPEELHRSLKARAAREGRTLSDLILADLPRLADKPSPEQVLARIERRAQVGAQFAEHDFALHAPHLIDVEVVSALRRLVASGQAPAPRGEEAIVDLL